MEKQKENDFEDPHLTSGRHVSYWVDSVKVPKENPLREHLETEVVIVGGGLAGLSIAYNLVMAGKAVVLVEDGMLGSGETGRTTGHLTAALDERYIDIEKTFGEATARLIAEAHLEAIAFIERTAARHQIECGFERVNGYLIRHPSDAKDALDKEFVAAQKTGLDLKKMDEAPGLLMKEKCLCFLNQGQFHSMKYLAGLSKAILQKGGKIFTHTHASKIDHNGIETKDGFTVAAKHVVVATNSPVNNRFVPFMKEFAFRTYAIGSLVKKGSVPTALWWDTGDYKANADLPPYHYARLHPYDADFDLLISGGEDHPVADTGDTDVSEEDRYALLETWTRRYFPIQKVVYRWSGQVIEPMDGVAYIGHNPLDHKNVYIVTGDSGNGLTHATIAGMLISDLICGKENKWEKIFRPSRLKLKQSVAVFKRFVQEWLSSLRKNPASKNVLSDIPKGGGAVVTLLEEQVGAYRDDEGRFHLVSAECTHLGCTIAWNADERSWDCPCHGSRFTYQGKVINGPANADLVTHTEYHGEGEGEREEVTVLGSVHFNFPASGTRRNR